MLLVQKDTSRNRGVISANRAKQVTLVCDRIDSFLRAFHTNVTQNTKVVQIGLKKIHYCECINPYVYEIAFALMSPPFRWL
jgi:hypothetical protein